MDSVNIGMETEDDLSRPVPLENHVRSVKGYTQPLHVTPSIRSENEILRKKNEDLEKENEELKRRVKGCQTLAFMLEDSEEKVKHLKETVEELTASRKSSISTRQSQESLQRPNHLPLSSSYLSNGSSNPESQKSHSKRVSRQNNTTRESSMTSLSVNGLNSNVVTDSSPSDLETEEQNNSNMEGNTSIHSRHESVGSKSPDISPLQSVHSAEFRSGAEHISQSSQQERLVTGSAGAVARSSPAQTPDADQLESFPSIAVKNLETTINQFVGNAEKSQLAPHLTKIVTQVAKLERENNTKTVLSRNLMMENAELKTKYNRMKEEYEELFNHQREEIDALKRTVRRVYAEKENEAYEVVEKAQVEKAMKVATSERKQSKEEEVLTTAPAHSADIDIEKLRKRISQLEKQNKEILHVNQQWDTHYNGMKTQLENHIKELQRQLQDRDTENTRLRSGQSASFEEQRQRDVDRMLLDARKRIEVEESARESAMEDLHLEKLRSETLNNRVGVLERQVIQLMQLKTGMENEIKRLNKALAETPPQPRTKLPEQQPPIRNVEEMRSHIEALEAQVLIYKEDFENERRDRERIASQIDEIKVEKENLKAERDTFAQQAHWYEEDFRREHEDKERLQRMLSIRTRDADYQFNIPPPRPVEKKAYPPPTRVTGYHFQEPRQYEPRRDAYEQYMGAHHIPEPPPYYEQQPQHRYNETQQGRLIPRGQAREDRPNQYPKYGQNLARNDLEVDAGNDVIDGEVVAGEALQNLKCPRCEREFLEEEPLRLHVERCVP